MGGDDAGRVRREQGLASGVPATGALVLVAAVELVPVTCGQSSETDGYLRASCPGDALTEALDAADNIYSPRGRAY